VIFASWIPSLPFFNSSLFCWSDSLRILSVFSNYESTPTLSVLDRIFQSRPLTSPSSSKAAVFFFFFETGRRRLSCWMNVRFSPSSCYYSSPHLLSDRIFIPFSLGTLCLVYAVFLVFSPDAFSIRVFPFARLYGEFSLGPPPISILGVG